MSLNLSEVLRREAPKCRGVPEVLTKRVDLTDFVCVSSVSWKAQLKQTSSCAFFIQFSQ